MSRTRFQFILWQKILVPFVNGETYSCVCFDDLFTVHLSIFILVINQIDVQNVCSEFWRFADRASHYTYLGN